MRDEMRCIYDKDELEYCNISFDSCAQLNATFPGNPWFLTSVKENELCAFKEPCLSLWNAFKAAILHLLYE